MSKPEWQKVIVNRIVSLCEKKEISYYELAHVAPVPYHTLLHIVKGESKDPGIQTIIKICAGLDISLAEFFDTEEFYQMTEEEVEE